MRLEDAENSIEKTLMQHAFQSRTAINGILELTPVCNMNCEMCYVRMDTSEVNRQGGLLSLENWLQIARQMKQAGVLFVLITGGEPLLYPGFRKLYLELKRMGMVVTVNTNGTVIDEHWADFFGKNSPRRINITLYGSNSRDYRNLCHYPEGFEKTINAIRLLKDKGVPVKLASSFTRKNMHDAPEIFQLHQQLELPMSCDTYMFPAIRERAEPYNRQIRMSPKEAAKLRIYSWSQIMSPEDFRSYVHKMLSSIQSDSQGDYGVNMSCLAGHCSFMINWQGHMRPCVMMGGPEISVLEHGFQKSWDYIVGETARVRLNPECQHCKLRPLCRTCAACAYLESGAFENIPDYMCEYARYSYEYLEEAYARMGRGQPIHYE